MSLKTHHDTVRNIAPGVLRTLRKKAADRGVSLNSLLLQRLEVEAGLQAEPRVHHDLDDLFGTWVHDEAVDRALMEQRTVEDKQH